ncbi:MAG: hypothetical protein QOD76_272 [Solirubrobacteraceae bacterium]|nr:hypothetical protein [Solirubrobacteraceae bacterium]
MAHTREELEALPSHELHDLAVKRALKHLDVRFLWRLIEALPAAEAAAGEVDEANADLTSTLAHVDDLTDSGRGEVADLLRPLYLEYLLKDSPERD